jgi:hypothetical protein
MLSPGALEQRRVARQIFPEVVHVRHVARRLMSSNTARTSRDALAYSTGFDLLMTFSTCSIRKI